MAVRVQVCQRQEGFVWINVIRTTLHKIWMTQTENEGMTKGKIVLPYNLSFQVYTQVFHFVATQDV